MERNRERERVSEEVVRSFANYPRAKVFRRNEISMYPRGAFLPCISLSPLRVHTPSESVNWMKRNYNIKLQDGDEI